MIRKPRLLLFVLAPAALALAAGAWALSVPPDDWKIAGPFGGTATTVAVDPQSPKTVLAGGFNSLLYQSTDNGSNWMALDFPKRNLGEVTTILVDPSNSKHYLVGVLDAFGGGLYESEDAGASWVPNDTIKNVGVRALAAAPSAPAEFVAGTLKGVMLSTDAGKSWSRISDEGNLEMQGITAVAVDPQDANVIYAGTPHLPWRTSDKGKTWESIHSGMIDDSDVFSIYVDPKAPTAVFASACSGIYASPNRGDFWKKLAGIPNTSRRTHVIREDPSRPGTIFAGTTMGLFRSPNAGGTWKVLTDTQVNSLAFDPSQSNSLYLALEYDGVGKSLDDGDTIRLVNDGFVDRQISSATRAGNRLFAIETSLGQTTGVFASSDNGATWAALPGVKGLAGVHLRSVTGDADVNDGKLLLAAAPRQLYKSVDGGQVWRPQAIQEIITPAAPPQPAIHRAPARGGRRAPARPMAKPRVILHPVQPSEIYGTYSFLLEGKPLFALATDTGLFFSQDGGTQWKRIAFSSSSSTALALYPSPASDGRLILKAPDALYLSTNGGEHWERIEFPLPMSDVNSVALSADSSAPLLVATRVGLYSSLDGGVKWSTMANGLQASTVSALTYAGDGRTAYVAEYGQLFRSNDGGANWAAVPTSLHSLPIRQLWTADTKSTRLYAITSGLGILFRD